MSKQIDFKKIKSLVVLISGSLSVIIVRVIFKELNICYSGQAVAFALYLCCVGVVYIYILIYFCVVHYNKINEPVYEET